LREENRPSRERERGGGGREREREKERTRKDQTSAESRRQRTHKAAPRFRQEKGLVITRNAGSVYHITEHSRVCVREREKRERRASERRGRERERTEKRSARSEPMAAPRFREVTSDTIAVSTCTSRERERKRERSACVL
jgi:hypothetical protein